MVMVADFIPYLKRCLQRADLRQAAVEMVSASRDCLPFTLRKNVLLAGGRRGTVRSPASGPGEPFAAAAEFSSPGHQRGSAAATAGSRSGPREIFVFLIDATLCSQSGKKTENTYSTGNRRRRPCKGRRYGKQKRAGKSCHSFTMGLLITPSGVRLPWSRPHYTREYCQRKGLTHRTTAEAAADLIRQLPLPEGAEVIVIGDTAYDAQAVRRTRATNVATAGFSRATPNAFWLGQNLGPACVRS